MKITPISENTFACNKDYSVYRLIINHKYDIINTILDNLRYYITMHDVRVYHEQLTSKRLKITEGENDSNIYEPNHLITTFIEGSFWSAYEIPLISEREDAYIHFILPFDHKDSILSLELYGTH